MFNLKTVELEWGGQTLKLETGRVARQAEGAGGVTACRQQGGREQQGGQQQEGNRLHGASLRFVSGRI